MKDTKRLSALLDTPAIKKLLTLFDNQNTIRLAAELQEKSNLTTDYVTDLLRVSRSTAFRYLNQLEDAGIIECTWEVSRSSAPKAVKAFSLTEEGRLVIEALMEAITRTSD
jgi:DNA-binding PadR family transcriptional regulator